MDESSKSMNEHPRQAAYCYECELQRVIDGDTVVLYVRLGFDVFKTIKVRMAGYNAPEYFTRNLEEKKKGLDAKHKLESLLVGLPLLVKTTRTKSDTDKTGKYGRYIGTIFHRDMDLNVNETMVRYLGGN